MINIPIKIRRNELTPLRIFIQHLVKKKSESITVIDYFNIRFLAKKMFDKEYILDKSPVVKFKVNINVYKSLVWLFDNNEVFGHFEYERVIYMDVVAQMDQQIKNLTFDKGLFVN